MRALFAKSWLDLQAAEPIKARIETRDCCARSHAWRRSTITRHRTTGDCLIGIVRPPQAGTSADKASCLSNVTHATRKKRKKVRNKRKTQRRQLTQIPKSKDKSRSLRSLRLLLLPTVEFRAERDAPFPLSASSPVSVSPTSGGLES